jgi:hypothetical protein
MSNKNTYHFTTQWQVEATCETIYRIFENAEDLPRWWPSVYLDVKTLQKNDANGQGRIVALHTKGWLPYTMRWQSRLIASDFPHGFTIAASGDLQGRGVWRFEDAGAGKCDITYNWQVSAEKPLLKRLSWLLKPIFSANHHWAMRQGEASLKKELKN